MKKVRAGAIGQKLQGCATLRQKLRTRSEPTKGDKPESFGVVVNPRNPGTVSSLKLRRSAEYIYVPD